MKVTLLGTVTVHGPAARVEVRGEQPALVIAHLVLERPRALGRDELSDLLWPRELPGHAPGAARQVVSRARAAFVGAGYDEQVVTTGRAGVRLDTDEDVEVDVERALASVVAAEDALARDAHEEALASADEALGLLRHELFATGEAAWIRTWQARLDAAGQRARCAAAAANLASGHLGRALELAETALHHDPYDERATRLVMRAHEESGNRPAALAAYERTRKLLDEDLGVRPSTETEELFVELLGEAPVTDPVRATPHPPGRRAGGVPFVGRDTELGAVLGALERCRGGHVEIVVLDGEAGIGKTRLANEAAALARAQGVLVLAGRALPSSGMAYQPLVEVVAQLVERRPDVVSALGSAAADLARLVPEVADVAGLKVPAVADEQARTRLVHALSSALTAASDAPLLVVIDDLQWADDDALLALRHLVASLEHRPCVLLLAVREPPPPVAALLDDLARLPATTQITLRGLSVAALVTLLGASDVELDSPAESVASVLERRTAGNPLYVTQLVREAEGSSGPFDPSGLPEAVSMLLDRRVAALGAAAGSVLALAAVSGQEFDLPVLEACATEAPDQLLDTVEHLCRLRLLEERDAERFGFVHELVRDAVLASTGETRRRRLHARIAAALVAAGAEAAEIAGHYVGAGPRAAQEAAEWLLAAGEEALDRVAWNTARDQFRSAGDLAPSVAQRCRALVGLGRAERALGNAEAAREAVEEARALAEAHRLPRELAAATLALVGGGGRGVAVDLVDARRAELLRDALRGLGDDDPELLVPTLGELALALVLTDAAEERAELCRRCVEAARASGKPELVARALTWRRVSLMGPEGTLERAADAEELLGLPADAVSAESRIAAWLSLVEDRLELGNRAAARVALDAATAAARDVGHPYWSWASTSWRVLDAIVDGRLDDAETLAGAAFAEQAPRHHPEAVAAFGVQLVDIRLFQGRANEVVPLLRDAADANPHIPAYRAVLALCCAESADHEGAREAFEHFRARRFALPPDSNWLLGTAVLADVAATLRDAPAAELLDAALRPWAGRQVVLNCFGGGGAYWGPVRHHLGRLARTLGDDDAARRDLETARREAENFGAPLFAGRIEAALGAVATPR